MEGEVQSRCGWAVAHTLHDVYSFIRDLSHRGRDACGIAAVGDGRIDVMKWKGTPEKVDLKDLHTIFPAEQYHTYLAHVRYATKGREDRVLEDAHPHAIGGRIIAHGNHILIRNADAVAVHNGQADLTGILNGAPVEDICDTKILLEYFWQNGITEMIKRVPGSYSMALADKDGVKVVRDRFAIKPGCLGLKDGKYCAASEPAAFSSNGALFIEDLEPGTIYSLSPRGGVKKERVVSAMPRHCFFEWNYISHIESCLDQFSVRRLRTELGIALAEEFPLEDDVITYLPRCPEVATRSYAKELGRESHFTKVFYKLSGERSFLGTNQADRKNSIENNLFLVPRMEDLLAGKSVIVIDDSTIRGTNSVHAKKLLQSCNVKQVRYLNYTPKIGIIGDDGVPRGCLFGVDMPPNDAFVVRREDGKTNRTDEEINAALGMEVKFLSVRGLLRAFKRAGIPTKELCYFCIGGEHPFT